jgi:hypothetical protein
LVEIESFDRLPPPGVERPSSGLRTKSPGEGGSTVKSGSNNPSFIDVMASIKDSDIIFKADVKNRISQVKKCNVPDFGLPNMNLFEEMKETSFCISENGLEQVPIKRSLWTIFYDCI